LERRAKINNFEERKREVLAKNDPLVLLSKLEDYSAQNLKEMSKVDKKDLLEEIEKFLIAGITPLEKYYEELKKYSSLPSEKLLRIDKEFFRKQVQKIRHAHKQDTANVMKKAEMAARRMLEKMMADVKITLKNELDSMVKDYNFMKSTLIQTEFQLDHARSIIKKQEMAIVELKLNKMISKPNHKCSK
jgi:hypothetical protein